VSINLRYGAPSTNRSVGYRLDLRIRQGISLEPLAILEQLYGLFTGRPVLAIESAATLNTLQGVARGAEVSYVNQQSWKMSTSDQQIGTTKTRARNPIHGAMNPVVSPFRGIIHPYVPIDRSYLGNLIVLVVLWFTFKAILS
jgi:hypothetical protein